MLRLSEVARHVVQPSGIVSTGWPAVRDTCGSLGIGFDPWQDGAGRLILAKDEHGLYAADTVVISIPRQVGKTYLIGWIVFALCIKFPGLTVLWTAHRYKTAGETYRSLAAMANRVKVKPHIESVPRGAGDQAVIFKNGSRIMFGARERGFGRGFQDVDVEIFDEAQILSQNAIDDMIPATNVAANPLIVYIGTPPKPADPGEVFSEFRERAVTGDSQDVLFIEISADPGADPLDRGQWRRANPSYPHRTPERAMLRMWKNLTRESFLREGLGIWDDDGKHLVIPLAAWSSRGDPSETPAPHVGPVVLAVDADPGRARTSIVAAGARQSGPPMIELTTDKDGVIDNRAGVDWAEARLIEICAAQPVAAVMIDKASAAASLIGGLERAGVWVVTTSSGEYAQACGQLFDAVVETGQVTHLDDPLFVAALKAATKRKLGDAWAWDKSNPAADITPITAATLALWGFTRIGTAREFVEPQRLR